MSLPNVETDKSVNIPTTIFQKNVQDQESNKHISSSPYQVQNIHSDHNSNSFQTSSPACTTTKSIKTSSEKLHTSSNEDDYSTASSLVITPDKMVNNSLIVNKPNPFRKESKESHTSTSQAPSTFQLPFSEMEDICSSNPDLSDPCKVRLRYSPGSELSAALEAFSTTPKVTNRLSLQDASSVCGSVSDNTGDEQLDPALPVIKNPLNASIHPKPVLVRLKRGGSLRVRRTKPHDNFDSESDIESLLSSLHLCNSNGTKPTPPKRNTKNTKINDIKRRRSYHTKYDFNSTDKSDILRFSFHQDQQPKQRPNHLDFQSIQRRRKTTSLAIDKKKYINRHSYMIATNNDTSPQAYRLLGSCDTPPSNDSHTNNFLSIPSSPSTKRASFSPFKRQQSFKRIKAMFQNPSSHPLPMSPDTSNYTVIADQTITVPSSITNQYLHDANVKYFGSLLYKCKLLSDQRRQGFGKYRRKTHWVHTMLVFRTDGFLYFERLKQGENNTPTIHTSPHLDSMRNNQLRMHEPPLCINPCLADLNYRQKRKHVFQLTSHDGSEYLFQADNDDTCINWINFIRGHNNPNEDADSYNIPMTLIREKVQQASTPKGRKKVLALKHTTTSTLHEFRPNTSYHHDTSSGKPSKVKVKAKSLIGDPSDFEHVTDTLDNMLNSSSGPNIMALTPGSESDTTNKHPSQWKKLKIRLKSSSGHGNLNSSRTHHITEKSVSSGASFGNYIEKCPMSDNNPNVPRLVDLCITSIESKALFSAGIYRIPGNDALKKKLIKEINKSNGNFSISPERLSEPNLMASLLKEFFRDLLDPIFPSASYEDILTAGKTEDHIERLQNLKKMIDRLPCVNYTTLSFLTKHLKHIADNSDKNKMTVKNLAMMFGPTLFVSKTSQNHHQIVADINNQWRILSTLIQYVDFFFGDGLVQEGNVIEPSIQDKSTTPTQSRKSNTVQNEEIVPQKNIQKLMENSSKVVNMTTEATMESSHHSSSMKEPTFIKRPLATKSRNKSLTTTNKSTNESFVKTSKSAPQTPSIPAKQYQTNLPEANSIFVNSIFESSENSLNYCSTSATTPIQLSQSTPTSSTPSMNDFTSTSKNNSVTCMLENITDNPDFGVAFSKSSESLPTQSDPKTKLRRNATDFVIRGDAKDSKHILHTGVRAKIKKGHERVRRLSIEKAMNFDSSRSVDSLSPPKSGKQKLNSTWHEPTSFDHGNVISSPRLQSMEKTHQLAMTSPVFQMKVHKCHSTSTIPTLSINKQSAPAPLIYPIPGEYQPQMRKSLSPGKSRLRCRSSIAHAPSHIPSKTRQLLNHSLSYTPEYSIDNPTPQTSSIKSTWQAQLRSLIATIDSSPSKNTSPHVPAPSREIATSFSLGGDVGYGDSNSPKRRRSRATPLLSTHPFMPNLEAGTTSKTTMQRDKSATELLGVKAKYQEHVIPSLSSFSSRSSLASQIHTTVLANKKFAPLTLSFSSTASVGGTENSQTSNRTISRQGDDSESVPNQVQDFTPKELFNHEIIY